MEPEVPGEELEGPEGDDKTGPAAPPVPQADTSMPAATLSFPGLDLQNWGAGWPPDTVGDVGDDFYIQAVNTSIGIWSKFGGAPLAAFTFDALWSNTGTPCDNQNRGDPTVVYDQMADRYIVADFAWSNIQNGPYYECIAVSMSENPVTGGWWLYAYRADDAAHPWLPDYPKMGIWPDGLYMTANMFDCIDASCNTAQYQEVRVYAFDRADLYSGAPLSSIVVDLNSTSYFSLLPANLRGAPPPAGRVNILVSQAEAFAYELRKFHVDWTTPASSTFTGPTDVSQTSYTFPAAVPQPGPELLDSLGDRMMMQAQYRNLSGTESLWVNHTVRTGPNPVATNPNGIQWAQINVTGGTINTTPVQQQIYGDVSDDNVNRWMGSLAVDGQGNMALGYSVSSSSTNPGIRYSGRLATDPPNTLPQGETTLQAGGGSQSGGFNRWGDYSAMTVDPDDCTFWYTTEYYAATGNNWQTRIGSFKFPSCTPIAKGEFRVTTGPALPSQILVDGQIADSWGLNWLNLTPGTHTLAFTHVEGYTEPAPQQVTINSGQTTTVNGSFTQRGSLRVITSPAVPSTITVDGIPRNNWGLWTDIPTGSHQVCYGPVADFTPPSCESANVQAGQLTTVTGTFTSSPGAPGETGKGELRVTTNPALASQILIDGVIRNSWGLDWLKLAPGTYTLSFTHVEGYTEPAPQQVTISSGQITTVNANFTQRGSLRVITSPAVPGTIFVDGLPRDNWGMWTDIPTGPHQVCFGAVQGLTAPACQNANVTAGQLTTVTGTYS